MAKLDSYDRAILKVLQREGRITKVALAEAVNLSPSPCWARLKRLEEQGYITGYRAEVDIARLGAMAEVVVELTLSKHKAGDFRAFETAIQTVPEITDCVATGGGVDYILRLAVRDVADYQRVMDELLEAEIGIDRYFGYIVTKTVKSAPPSLDLLSPGD